jgi:hypothetical protein
VVALAAACDISSETSFDGVAGQNTAGTALSEAGSTAKAGSDAGGSASPAGGMSTGGANAGAGQGMTGGMSGSSTGGSMGGSTGGSTAGASSGAGGGTSQAGEGGMATAGDAGSGNGGANEAGMGGDTSAQAGATGEAGETGQGGSGDVGCGGKSLGWQARASSVMFLMDRSGTMFDLASQPWLAVRDAALPVIDAYDGSENIGFMPVAGEIGACPITDDVAPAPGNYPLIAAKYNALVKPTKGEAPFTLALTRAQQLLVAAPAGEAFVIMVIDGQPDFCGDGNDLCPIDSVVARIQTLKAAGITTLVAGLPIYVGADTGLYAAALQSYANAGAGLPVASAGATAQDIYFQCEGVPAWKAELVSSGKPAQQALGSYSASPGAASVTALNPADAAGMTAAFSQLFARTHSCSFETHDGKVVLGSASSGVVKLDGVPVSYDATNGWHMKSDTVVELVGGACDTLRATPAAAITIDFPCGAVTN